MEVLIRNDSEMVLDEDLWARRAEKAMQLAGVAQDAELSMVFVDDSAMAELNRQYRQLEGPTDVLSFEGMLPLLGDVVISPAYAARSAELAGHSLERELCVLLVHGLLHLMGMDHAEPDDERIMFERQAELVEALGC